MFLGNNLLSWSSKRYNTTSISSVEVKYNGVANAIVESCWLHILFVSFTTLHNVPPLFIMIMLVWCIYHLILFNTNTPSLLRSTFTLSKIKFPWGKFGSFACHHFLIMHTFYQESSIDSLSWLQVQFERSQFSSRSNCGGCYCIYLYCRWLSHVCVSRASCIRPFLPFVFCIFCNYLINICMEKY